MLKDKTEELLEPWKNVDGRNFSPSYVEFEEEEPKIEAHLNELRQSLKQQIAVKVKQKVKAFYCNLF